MFLTATDQRKPQTALWRLLTLIITVVASIGLTATSASAATAITAHSSSGRTASVGLETRVGVTNQNLVSSSARISTVSPACVGENQAGYDGFVLVSCVATNNGATVFRSAGSGGTETFYRTMSAQDYAVFQKTGVMPATAETFISPTQSFAQGYGGVTVEITVKSGTTSSLQAIGVRDASALTSNAYPGMPGVGKGWSSSSAYFKGEGAQVNIGLGKGAALDTFNGNVVSIKKVGP